MEPSPTQPPTQPLVVDREETARLLRVNPRTVDRMLARGSLRRVLGSRRVLVPYTSIVEFVERRPGPEEEASDSLRRMTTALWALDPDRSPVQAAILESFAQDDAERALDLLHPETLPRTWTGRMPDGEWLPEALARGACPFCTKGHAKAAS